jgi:PAS domain-containing protein
MPISIGDLTRDVRSVAIAIAGGTLNVTYRPSAFNAAQEAKEQELRDRGAVLRSIAESLADTIISWDLLDEDERPYPLTRTVEVEVEDGDGLRTETHVEPHPVLLQMGMDNLNAISRAILEDLLPNLRRSGTSAATSWKRAK